MWQGRRTQARAVATEQGRGLGVKPRHSGRATSAPEPDRTLLVGGSRRNACPRHDSLLPACSPPSPLVLGLAFSLFAFSAVGPTTSGASGRDHGREGQRRRRLGAQPQGLALRSTARSARTASTAPASPAGSTPASASPCRTRRRRRPARCKRIKRSNARRGDLVFFYGDGGVYHVAIYAGHGYIWHAPYSGTRVRRDHIYVGQPLLRPRPVAPTRATTRRGARRDLRRAPRRLWPASLDQPDPLWTKGFRACVGGCVRGAG